MNGAKMGRGGRVTGGAPRGASSPSDPFGTGLLVTGGYANGHPAAPASQGKRKGPAKGKKSAAPNEARRRGPGSRSAPKNQPASENKQPRGRSGGRSGGASGDDWQPRSAKAHESHLGRLGKSR